MLDTLDKLKGNGIVRISKLFGKGRPVYSFEIFPPKATSPVETVYDTLEALGDLSPDYISVTYGAGGSVVQNRTTELSGFIKRKLKIEPMAHLTCINSGAYEVDKILDELEELGIKNILALRGDIRADAVRGEFKYASDLISHINKRGDFDIVAACYPEKHPECSNIEMDIENLKRKADLGVGHLVTQMFFDNDNFYSFMDMIRAKGINQPVVAGIMPITNAAQIEKMSNMCGAFIPEKCLKMVEKYGNNPIAMRDAGIIYATNQIMDLVANGVDGVHIYTMNNPYVARKITLSIGSIIGGDKL